MDFLDMKLIKPKPDVYWVNPRKAPHRDGGGLSLEVSAEIEGAVWELFAVVADEDDDTLWVEFYVQDRLVRLPYAAVKDAIDIAPSRVFSGSEFHRMNATGGLE